MCLPTVTCFRVSCGVAGDQRAWQAWGSKGRDSLIYMSLGPSSGIEVAGRKE